MKRAVPSGARRFYQFGQFRLDANRHRLLRDNEVVLLSPKAVETLTVLVQNSGKLLHREALMQAVWADTIVEDANLTVAVSQLRKALNQNGDTGEFIQTVPRVGYRFVADVREMVEEPASLIAKGDRPSGPIEIDDAGEAEAPLAKGTAVVPAQSDSKQISAEDSGQYSPSVKSSHASPASSAQFAAGYERSRTDSGRYNAMLSAGGIAAIAIVGVAALFFARYRATNASTQRGGYKNSTYETTPIPVKSVAVLPFDNLSDDKQNAYFASGVQDEIISDLAKITELKVISRTSADLYRSGNPRNSREIGQQLGVAHLLEGSVQRIGNRVRINAQLVVAHTDTHVWAQIYDRDVADLFAIQSEIATAIADELHAKISPAVKLAIEQPPTTDLTAFDLYTRAKDLFVTANDRLNGKQDLLRATDLLNEAVARDPEFFGAYCQLVRTHDLLYLLGHDHSPSRLALAEAAVQAAFRLRPDAGEAHLARAENLYQGYLDHNGALAELEVAGQTLPNDAWLVALKGFIERRQGRWDESTRDLEHALDLDPRNPFMLRQIAYSYAYLRRYAEAESACDRALAIEPDDAATKSGRAYLELAWKADTGPLHQVIDSIRATNPAAMSQIASTWVSCALAERDPAAAKSALIAAGQNPPLDTEAFHFNRHFAEGIIARMTNDDEKARSAFLGARTEQEKIVQAQPNYGPPLVVLGLIDAALGRKEQAVREGRRAVELLPVEKDSINGPLITEYFAMIAAWVGDDDLACEQLAVASRLPSGVHYGELKLFPFWDPLRGDPRFEQIAASLAPKETALKR